MPLFSRILAYFTGHVTAMHGPWSLSPPISLALSTIGLIFLLFASITFNFPTSSPVNKDSMNYTSAAIGVIGLVSVVTWLTTGRKYFTGPGDIQGLGPGEKTEGVIPSESEHSKTDEKVDVKS